MDKHFIFLCVKFGEYIEALQFFKIPLCLEPPLVVSVMGCTQYIFLGQFDNVAQTEHAHLKMPLMHLGSV